MAHLLGVPFGGALLTIYTVQNLIKPPMLSPGDRVATVSLSWGGAGDPEVLWRYNQGKQRLQDAFGLEIVEMPNTLAGSDYLYQHPEARAADLMAAFADPSIKGIITNIGGDDTLRLLPHIDFSVIRDNPKVFMGYSDTTVNHFMCLKAGLSSIYGPAVLSDFAENLELPEYTYNWVHKTLFSTEPLGEIPTAPVWTSQYLEWADEDTKDIMRKFEPNTGIETVQGSGSVTGSLIGGCIEVVDWIRGTPLFPDASEFDDSILFFETSEDVPTPDNLLFMLRSLAALDVLPRANGLIFGKPYDNMYYDEYKAEIVKVLAECGRTDMPVLYNLSFGHCEPKFCLPYGARAQIDCENQTFSILESGVA